MIARRQHLEDPRRLRESASDATTLEGRAALHLGRCAEIEIPPEPPLELRGAGAARWRWLPVPVAVAVVLIGLIGAGLAGAVGVRRMLARFEPQASAGRSEPERARSARSVPRPAPAVLEEPAADEKPVEAAPSMAVAPARNRAAAHRPDPSRASSVQPAEAPAQPAAVSPLAEETALLESALRRLRRDRDATGALDALDGYQRRFPHGLLAREADTTRVEAFLLLGRRSAALGVLDRMSFGASPRDTEMLLTRGTLRADAGRCLEAEDDVTQVLSRASSSTAVEHALWTRASCRSRRADWTGARGDLERYLQRFPDGRFSSEARRALSTM